MFRTAAAAIVAAALPAGAAELTPVSYGLNWVPQPEHGGFYQALADGSYAACGLEVTLVPGGPQVNNRALMLAGKIDFYMGTTLGALLAAEAGVPAVVVAALFQKDPQVILAHPGKAKTFDDLNDLTLYVSDQVYATAFQWMVAKHGFRPEKRKPYTYNPAAFVVDPDSAQQGYATAEPLIVEQAAGWRPDVFLLADAGYDPYSTTIETLAETVRQRPEVVQCFVDGSIKGWYNYLWGDNAAANAMIKAANPEITDALIDFSIAQMKALGIVDSGESLTEGVGTMTAARVQGFYDQMVEAGVLKPGLDVATTYSLDFIGKGVGLDLKPAE